jgi:hypothetical protein
MSRDRRLAIRYWPAGREARERVVDPLGLLAKGGTWYLVARRPTVSASTGCRDRERATADESFQRPADFDLAAHWQRTTEEPRRDDSATRRR